MVWVGVGGGEGRGEMDLQVGDIGGDIGRDIRRISGGYQEDIKICSVQSTYRDGVEK